jgi:hypothetical protein
VTVSSTERVKRATGDGVTTAIPIPFQFYAVAVYVDGTLQTNGVHYNLTGGNGNTGTCTFVTAPAASAKIVIISFTSASQGEELHDFDDAPAEVYETMTDKAVMLAADALERNKRTLRGTIPHVDLPELDFAGTPNTVLHVDEDGVPELIPAQEALEADLEDAIVAAATSAAVELAALPYRDMPELAEPDAPAADKLRLYAADQDGVTVLRGKTSGSDIFNFSHLKRSETGARIRALSEKLGKDVPTVLDFDDVDETGTTDSTDGINAALDAGGVWYVPPGTYDIEGTLDYLSSSTKLLGFGPSATILNATSPDLPLIRFADGIGTLELKGMTLTRAVSATSGGNGIECLGSLGQCDFSHLTIEKHVNGAYLGPTDFSHFSHVISQKNLGAGVVMVPIGTDGQMQWQLAHVLSQMNVQQGFLAQASAGPAQMTMGEWINVASFGNTGAGVAIVGLLAVPIHDFRMSNFFHGENGGDNVYLDTYGTLHRLSAGTVELAGRSNTGPTLATAPTGSGNGVKITANNVEVELSDILRDANSYNGVETSGTHTIITGGRGTDNGQALDAGNRNDIKQVAGKVTRYGGSSNNTGANTSQQYGEFYTTNLAHTSFADLSGNTDAGRGSAVELTLANFGPSQPLTDLSANRPSADLNGNAFAGRRNRLVNGCFRVWQRQTAAVADDAYCFDRWYALTQSNPITVSQQTFIEDGLPSAIRLTQSDASAQRMGLAQIIESADCTDLRGAIVTLSARVRCSTSATIRCAILEHTGTADTLTSDFINTWTSANYSAGNFFTSTDLTVRAVGSLSVLADTAATIRLGDVTALQSAVTLGSSFTNLMVVFWIEGAAAQNVTLDIGKAQLEPGARATPFERVPLQTEKNLCMRRYQKSFPAATAPAQNAGTTGAVCLGQGAAASTAQVLQFVSYPVEMASNPSLTIFNPGAANAHIRNLAIGADFANTTTSISTTRGHTLQGDSPGASAEGNLCAYHYTAVAEL